MWTEWLVFQHALIYVHTCCLGLPFVTWSPRASLDAKCKQFFFLPLWLAFDALIFELRTLWIYLIAWPHKSSDDATIIPVKIKKYLWPKLFCDTLHSLIVSRIQSIKRSVWIFFSQWVFVVPFADVPLCTTKSKIKHIKLPGDFKALHSLNKLSLFSFSSRIWYLPKAPKLLLNVSLSMIPLCLIGQPPCPALTPIVNLWDVCQDKDEKPQNTDQVESSIKQPGFK